MSSSIEDCLFCKIASKAIPSRIAYEDDDIFAFEDINPQAPTHTVIIPRKHIPTINDLKNEDIEILGKLILTAKSLAAKKGLATNGYRLIFNCNKDAGQTVFHIHLHLIGGRVLGWPPG